MKTFEQNLRERCHRQGIPIEEWGLPGTTTKSFTNFLEEIEEGSAVITKEGPVVCYRHSVCSQPYYRSTRGRLYLLHEAYQEYLWPGYPPIRKDRNIPYQSESWQQARKETPVETAWRCFVEENDLSEALVRKYLPQDSIKIDRSRPLWTNATPYLSDTFLGLPTVRTRTFMRFWVHRMLYERNGYQVLEKNIRTTSKYRFVPEGKKRLVF